MQAAGRSSSGDGYGWDILRVIPPAILTGQAVGTAASLALSMRSRSPRIQPSMSFTCTLYQV